MARYSVKPDGKAPAGLSAGDEVQTNGGLYRITAVNPDGSYESVRVQEAGGASSGSAAAYRRSGVTAQTDARLSALEGGFAPGAETVQAGQTLAQARAARPADYVSRWDDELDALYAALRGRAPFRYDLGKDTLYMQYRQQYQELGRLAMTDTMAQAAALTGGYGSSYSQAAGQQAYHGYLQKLNDLVPQLYREARDAYDSRTQQLRDRYALVRAREQTDYGRYRDAVRDYRDALSDAERAYSAAYDRDYRRYADMLDYWSGRAGEENAEFWQERRWQKSAAKNASGGRSSARSSQTKQKKRAAKPGFAGASAAAPSAGGGGGAGGVTTARLS